MDSILNILKEEEYAPYYANYLAKVSHSDIIKTMINDLEEQIKILEGIPEEKFSFRYQEGKWSIAELLQHICDSETVFAYRALSFSRNDKTNLPGFDENDWAKNASSDQLSKKNLIGLFKTTRNHTIALFKTFTNDQLMIIGTANKTKMSVRAAGFTIIGHNRHHFEVLTNIYL
jgi:uncharacterized damage-inducible protein DinB